MRDSAFFRCDIRDLSSKLGFGIRKGNRVGYGISIAPKTLEFAPPFFPRTFRVLPSFQHNR